MKARRNFESVVAHYQKGDLKKALELCREVVREDPKHVDAIHLLSVLYYQLEEYDLAAHYVRDGLLLQPDDYYAFFLLGNILDRQQNTEKAEACLKKAIELNPSFADAYFNLALVLEKEGRLDEALVLYQRALDLAPDLPDVRNNLGNLLLKMKHFDEAIVHLRRALELNPDYILALNNMGMALKEKGLSSEAGEFFEKALLLNPSFPDSHFNMGTVLKAEGRCPEAEVHFRRAIELRPSFFEAYLSLADALKEMDRTREAETYLQRALSISPSRSDAYCHLAAISEERGRLDEALSYYQNALRIDPCDATIHWNMSLTLLSAGRFEDGWREYEWRSQVDDFRERPFSLPRWDGSPLGGRRLFVYAEQGVGEEIMFSSCLPEVIAEADSCVVECDRRLVPLFNRSFPRAAITVRLNAVTLPSTTPRAEMRIAIGSLPKFLRPDLSRFPQRKAYLTPDPSKVELWRDRLKALGEGLKIGISWRGGGKVSERRLRSTVLAQWSPLFSLRGVRFINLQYGECAEELREAAEKFGVALHDWEDADPLKDLDNFAAEISALDLVISVDNATVHMAGALGAPVWILLPYSCDWRWMQGFEDTPWYATARLIRQRDPGDWEEVFARTALDLGRFISEGTSPEITHSYRPLIRTTTEHTASHIRTPSPGRAHRCAVVTPVGPGHEVLYGECLSSVERSFAAHKGPFSGIVPVRIDDRDGMLGRSKARNLGIRKASEHGAEWIFFLDADDVMAPSAFDYAARYIEEYDAVWGSIWTIEKGEETARERPHQLPFIYDIADIISCDPFETLQMGHFVRTETASSVLFDESLDSGEDFDYYLRIWEDFRCIKIPLPFFYNRRGYHSGGPRSATGKEWRKMVDQIIQSRALSYKQRKTPIGR